MSDDEKLAVAEAYRKATAANDAHALRAIHEPDARTWHNFDGASVSVEDSATSLAWLHRQVPDLHLDDVRVTPTSAGFVLRWTMRGTAPGGQLRLPSCVVVELSPAGKVARAAEYLDSAQLAVLRSGTAEGSSKAGDELGARGTSRAVLPQLAPGDMDDPAGDVARVVGH